MVWFVVVENLTTSFHLCLFSNEMATCVILWMTTAEVLCFWSFIINIWLRVYPLPKIPGSMGVDGLWLWALPQPIAPYLLTRMTAPCLLLYLESTGQPILVHPSLTCVGQSSRCLTDVCYMMSAWLIDAGPMSHKPKRYWCPNLYSLVCILKPVFKVPACIAI